MHSFGGSLPPPVVDTSLSYRWVQFALKSTVHWLATRLQVGAADAGGAYPARQVSARAPTVVDFMVDNRPCDLDITTGGELAVIPSEIEESTAGSSGILCCGVGISMYIVCTQRMNLLILMYHE